MNLRDTYNEIAIDFFEEHVNATWWIEGIHAFVSLLPKQAKVLDVGCGAGYKAKYLADSGKRITGLDFSESMLKIAKNRLPEAEFICADIFKKLPVHKDFDGILAEAVFLHVPKKEMNKVFENVSLHLKPGGYFYISFKDVKNGVEERIKKEEKYGKTLERFFSYLTLDEIHTLFERHGYRVVYEKVHPEDTSWLQVIGKKLT